MARNDKQLIVRIAGKNGTVWYPRYVKNTEGEWALKDKSFQKMYERNVVLACGKAG